jgi:hypothetical protein
MVTVSQWEDWDATLAHLSIAAIVKLADEEVLVPLCLNLGQVVPKRFLLLPRSQPVNQVIVHRANAWLRHSMEHQETPTVCPAE